MGSLIIRGPCYSILKRNFYASAFTLASGRAYFRLRLTNMNTSSAYPDYLMIAFQVQYQPPVDINTPLDTSPNDPIHNYQDHSYLELLYQLCSSKSRKKNMYLGQRISNGWSYLRSAHLTKQNYMEEFTVSWLRRRPCLKEG